MSFLALILLRIEIYQFQIVSENKVAKVHVYRRGLFVLIYLQWFW